MYTRFVAWYKEVYMVENLAATKAQVKGVVQGEMEEDNFMEDWE